LLIECSVAEICSVKFKVGPQNRFFAPPARGGGEGVKRSGEFKPNFSNSSHYPQRLAVTGKNMCPSLTLEVRCRKKKERKKERKKEKQQW